MPENYCHHQEFEELGDSLRLRIPHANLVRSRTPFRTSNTIPECRLFLAAGDSQPGACAIRTRPLSRNQEMILDPGDLAFMPAHVPLEFVFEPGLVLYGFHFSLTIGDGMDIFLHRRDCVKRADDHGVIPRVFDALSTTDQISGLFRARGLLMQLIAGFIDLDVHALRRRILLQQRYDTLLRFIQEEADAGTRLPRLAAEMAMSVSTLSRSFSRDMGIPLKHVLDRTLIEKACNRLLFSESSIKEVAADLGFRNEFYFSRFFKKYTGLPPSQYRVVPGMKVP